jgi:copper chaperone
MIEFRVPDMTCEGCVRAIASAVRDVDPDAGVTADLDRHFLRIRSHRDADALAEALREAGFTPEPV